MSTLLHAHEHSGDFLSFLDEVVWHGFLDTAIILPFLFLAYLLMEFIEHKASDKARTFMEKSGSLGPLVGALAGAIPQCGFSAAASNFYTGRVITLGTLVAVFLSTSDEMLIIMISEGASARVILPILAYKAAVGIIVGFIIDGVLRLMGKEKKSINIDEICDNDNCHCERGIWLSALHHTLTVGGFILLVTVLINALIFFVGSDRISAIMYDKPFVSHLIAALLGLIPNCAVSVALTDFCLSGFITAGTMLSGLFSGAGVGLLILFKVNKNLKENLTVTAILLVSAVSFGLLADLIGFSAILV